MKIAIVGGGATGVIAAIHFLDALGAGAAITIYDPASELAAGMAYGRDEPTRLLNVPVERMGCRDAYPGDFLEWLRREHPAELTSKYYPYVGRAYYRQYLQAALTEAERRAKTKITWLRRRVTQVERTPTHYALYAGEGAPGEYSQVFLATGYRVRRETPGVRIAPGLGTPQLLSIYDEVPLPRLNPEASVATVGSGLSAIDAYRELRGQGHRGKISFLSRHGFFPLTHPAPREIGREWSPQGSPRELLRQARELFRTGRFTWPEIADQIRHSSTRIWGDWSDTDRAQFKKWLKPYWEVIRHRVPATVIGEIQSDIQAGRAELLRARSLELSAQGSGIQLNFLVRGEKRQLLVDHCILANGVQVEDELFRHQPDAAGARVGPASRDLKWEITAIPEIRVQALALSQLIRLKWESDCP